MRLFRKTVLFVLLMGFLLLFTPFAPLPLTWSNTGGRAMAAAPQGWENVSPSYFSRDRTSVYAVDASTAWVVASKGTIIKTSDGGSSWKLQRTGTEVLTSVCAVNASTAWAVGYGGVILKTSDGGDTWLPQGPGTGNLYSVSAVDANTAWAVGDEYGTYFNTYILKTVDGGATWTRQEPTGGWGLTGVSAVNAQTAWAVRPQTGEILKTEDGGANWTVKYTPPGPDMNLFRIEAIDLVHVWAVDWQGHVVKTADGGESWSVVDLGVSDLSSVSAVDASTGWVVGTKGNIIKTGDGWQHWASQDAGTPAPSLRWVFAVNGSTAWAVGDGGVILKTSDGGNHWSPQIDTAKGFTGNVRRVSAVSADTAWVIEKGLYKTTDGGSSWKAVVLPPNANVKDVTALNANDVWVALDSSGTGSIYKSSDGGATWNLQYTAPAGVSLSEVYAVNASVAWAIGTGGFVAKTVDGGMNWSSPGTVTGIFGELLSICAVDAETAWVTAWSVAYTGSYPKNEPPYFNAPYYPIIMKTTDGGATWPANQTGTYNEGFSDISAVGAASAMAVGRDIIYSPIPGFILITTSFPFEYYFYLVTLATYGGLVTHDGGEAWEPRAENAPFTLYGVDMVNPSTAWAVGTGGNILKTEDGGDGWAPEISRTTATLREVDGVDAVTAWAVGDDGTVLKTGSGAPTPAPVVTSVNPTEAGQFAFAVDLTVQGSGFKEGASLSLEKGGTVINASNVIVSSETMLTGTVALFGAEPGSYDVVVTNPDSQQGRLVGGFNVSSACGTGSGAAMLPAGISLGLLSLAGSLRARRRRKRR